MYIDAHTHIERNNFKDILANKNIAFVASAGNPEECRFLLGLQKDFENLHCSFGIHPWLASSCTFEEILPFLEKAPYIGEIGMDCVWCDTDLNIQESIFKQHLDYAQKTKKPVILHTKGCEEQVSDILIGYSMPILVHWYSCGAHLERYIQQGCFFTIGPDVGLNPIVADIVKTISLDRILVETDGLSALEWVFNRHVSATEIPHILQNTIREIANIKNCSISDMVEIVRQNTHRFYRFQK